MIGATKLEPLMARVEWALLCDLAYFDAYRNLCMIGVQTQAPVPTLAAGSRRLAIAARVVELRPRPDVAVSVSTPDGRLNAKAWCERIQVEAVGDYVVISLGGVPLMQEGIYRFEVSLDAWESASIDMPVVVGALQRHSESNDTRLSRSDSASSSRGRNHAGLV
jgi:hypothetical protein